MRWEAGRLVVDEARGDRLRYRLLLVAATLAVAMGLLVVLTPFFVVLMVRGIGFGLAVMGLNLMSGYGGQPSFGQGAFMGAGALFAAYLVVDRRLPLVVVAVGTFLFGMVLGGLLGLVAGRIKGVYLSVLTLSLAASFGPVAKSIPQYTGGASGRRVGNVLIPPEWTSLGDTGINQWKYLVAVAVGVACLGLMHHIVSGRSGRVIVAVRDDPVAAAAYGINPMLVVASLFALGAAFAAVGGMVSMTTFGFIAADEYSIFISLELFAGMVIGGKASMAGSLFGGIIVAVIPWIGFSLGLPVTTDLFVAGTVLVFSQALRGGLAGLGRAIESRWVRVIPAVPGLWRPGASAGPADALVLEELPR